MRIRCATLAFLFLVATFFLSSVGVVLAVNTWSQTNWADGSFTASTGVVTATANQVTLAPNANWFDVAWKYRQSISVTNASGGTLTDYQIPITVNTSTLISAAKMKADCSDLRITNAAGTLLPYWIATSPTANTCGQTTTKVWVKAGSLATSGTTLYLYYGHSSATSLSNGANVFAVFADFTTGTALPTGWTKTDVGTSGTATVGSGQLTITNTNGEDVWDAIYGGTHVYNNTKVTGSFTAEALVTTQSNANEWAKSGISVQNSVASGGGNGQAFIIVTPNNGTPFQYQSTTGELCTNGVCSTVIAPNVNLGNVVGSISLPMALKLTKNASNQVSGYVSTNGTTWTQKGITVAPWGVASSQYITLFVTPHNTSAAGNATYTYFFVRQYAATEPVAASPSNEEKTYTTTGNLTSSIIDTGQPSNFGTLTYGAVIPTNTAITVKVRSSNSSGMTGATEFATCNAIATNTDISANNCITDGQRYLQYQATLTTTDATASPTLQSVALGYEPITYTVTYTAGTHGSITGTASQTVNYGADTSSVTATADSLYHFTNWSDESTANPRIDHNVAANIAVTANFAANDTNAPVISAVTADPQASSAAVTWTTDENASSQVQYGLTTAYGFSTTEADTATRVQTHTVNLTSLKACARYYYRVISKDATNNQTASAQKSFNTLGCATSSITGGTESALTTAGGSVQLVNNHSTAKLVVPDNYAAAAATFQLNKLDGTSAPTGPDGKTIANSNLYDLVAVTTTDQQLTTFNQPITFTITYGTDTESQYEESTLDVYKYAGSNWSKKNCTLDTTDNTITCTLTGFSVYGVLGTPKQTSSSSSTSSSTASSTGSAGTGTATAPTCADRKPAAQPDLFQINTTNQAAQLFFTPLADTNTYYISFSKLPNAEEHGAQAQLQREGVQNFTLNALEPGVLYYFKVRGQNGCMPGDWSNIMTARTDTTTYYRHQPMRTRNRSVSTTSKSTTSATPLPTTTPTYSPPSTPITPAPTITKRCFLLWCW
jgi:hypothetical protein